MRYGLPSVDEKRTPSIGARGWKSAEDDATESESRLKPSPPTPSHSVDAMDLESVRRCRTKNQSLCKRLRMASEG